MDHAGQAGDLPDEVIEIDQVIAHNMRRFRRAAGLTQDDLGLRTGLSGANISALERSADSDRDRRRFDAQMITALSLALGVPIIALFLPPADDGTRARYLFRPVARDPGQLDMAELMDKLVMPDSDAETVVAYAYRDAFNLAAARYMDADWARRVAIWLQPSETPERRAERAARLRDGRDALLRTADELGELADAIDPGEKEDP